MAPDEPPKMNRSQRSALCDHTSRAVQSGSERFQGEEDVDAVLEPRQVATGQLLDAFDPVANGVDVQVQRLRRSGPGAGRGEEGLQGGEQVGVGTAIVLEDRTEDAVAVGTTYFVGERGEQENVRRDLVRRDDRNRGATRSGRSLGEAGFFERTGQGVDRGLAADPDREM